MHELGIVTEVVAAVEGRAAGRRVRRVVLQIGQLTAIAPDAVRFCFDLVAEGTAVEGAVLEIVETPGRARCRACDSEIGVAWPIFACACGAVDLDVLAGDEVLIREMEVT
jgi:hydrogenase nickel incorporation protein HypA/HybF